MYLIKMLHRPTGEIRELEINLEWDGSSEFLWSEGNFSCDCNRMLFFTDWKEDVEDEELDCGTENYAILGIWAEGELVYKSEVDEAVRAGQVVEGEIEE